MVESPPLTRTQKWYRQQKALHGKKFLQHRAKLQRELRARKPEFYKKYYNDYLKGWIENNKEHIREYARNYVATHPKAQKKRNERTRKWWQRQKEQLTDTYIQLMVRNRTLSRQEIEIRRWHILILRESRVKYSKEYILQAVVVQKHI